MGYRQLIFQRLPKVERSHKISAGITLYFDQLPGSQMGFCVHELSAYLRQSSSPKIWQQKRQNSLEYIPENDIFDIVLAQFLPILSRL